MSRATDTATEWAFAAGWRVVRVLPERAAYRTFDRAADALWRRRGGDVVQLERNLARVHPGASPADLRDLSRLGMRSYLRYWCDAFRLPTWSPARINDTFDLVGVERLDDAIRTGTGALVALNHGGNWDHAGAWATLRYGTLTTVAERLRPEGLYERFLAYRESLGMEIVPLGEPGLVRTLARRLREGRLVPLLGDRDLSHTGVIVDLFGEPASLPAGPAVLSIMTGAPLIPAVSWYAGERAVTALGPTIPVPPDGTTAERTQRMVQQVAQHLEAGLREHSVDWHMLQPVWLEDARRERAREGAR
jgi:KDO2-lipid IV(A) lauroyltransferase